jgi:hypothetical protein
MDHVALGPARQVVADTSKPKRLNPFERYLSLWVALCMVAGVLLGLAVPGLTDGLRRLEFGAGHDLRYRLPSRSETDHRTKENGRCCCSWSTKSVVSKGRYLSRAQLARAVRQGKGGSARRLDAGVRAT